MPPKPGFYYYDSIRAFRVYLVLALFGVGIYLSKLKIPLPDDLWELYKGYRVVALVTVLFSALLIIFFKRLIRLGEGPRFLRKFVSEPRPSDYSNREQFIAALQSYGERKGYKSGWVFHRTKELWP